LIKQKKQMIERFAKFDNAQQDPFYRMKEIESSLEEGPNSFVFRARVPEHERKNIDVLVKDNEIIVSGQRAFEEKVDKDGRTVSTHTSQSLREKIPLTHPVVPDAVSKDYENGYITVHIPKI